MAKWNLLLAKPDAGAAGHEKLLRENPVLLLSRLQSPDYVADVVRRWDPAMRQEDDGVAVVGDEIRWHGPIQLSHVLRADAGLPGGWPVGYIAQTDRRRVKVPESRDAESLRRRFPAGLPTGSEAFAWRLVAGMARRLHGAARLPGAPLYTPEPVSLRLHVYGHEALPWTVLREVLSLAVPDLVRNGVFAGDDYILERQGVLAVRARPIPTGEALPYAIRQRAGDDWPHTCYELSPLVRPETDGEGAVERSLERVKEAAQLLCEVTGGVLLDADGLPVA